MGPMGPMMGGWRPGSPMAGAFSGGSWDAGWLGAVLTVVLVLALVMFAAIGLAVWHRRRARAAAYQPHSAEALLRERYARGELTRQQFRDALVDVLKDRYVRGELDLPTYEAQLELLLQDGRPGSRAGGLPIG